MKTESEKYGLIEQYLKGALPEAQKLDFEKSMETDIALAEEVGMQKLVNELVLEKGLADIRKKVGEDLSTGAGKQGFKNSVILSLAGVFLLGTGTYFMYSGNLKNVEKPIFEKTEFHERQIISTIDKRTANPVKFAKKVSPAAITRLKSESGVPSDSIQELKKAPEATFRTPMESLQENTPAPVEKIVEKIQEKQPCAHIFFEVHTSASCQGKNNGSVQFLISGIRGGKKPYVYSLSGSVYNQEGVFTELAPGSYVAEVKDNSGCNAEKVVAVGVKTCTEFKDYSFNPESEGWKLPFAGNETGTIKIMDKSGTIVFTAKVASGNPDEWNGKTLSGEQLETGSYLYVLQTDKGEVRQGYITILH